MTDYAKKTKKKIKNICFDQVEQEVDISKYSHGILCVLFGHKFGYSTYIKAKEDLLVEEYFCLRCGHIHLRKSFRLILREEYK